MNISQVNKENLTLDILEIYLNSFENHESINKEDLKTFAHIYKDNIELLYDVYEFVIQQGDLYQDSKNQIRYMKYNEKYRVEFLGKEITLIDTEFKNIIVTLIDIFEPIYPLGTVVNLKNEYLEEIFKTNDIGELKVVIINRFLYLEDSKNYFHYSGVIYPTGSLGTEKVLNFTSRLIDKVVNLGYGDEQEDAFVYLMKKELILENNMNSIGFATKEEQEVFQSKITKR